MAHARLTRIYVLRDPRDREVRYVGKTARTLAVRLLEHMKLARDGGKPPVCVWVRSLIAAGLHPAIEAIDETRDGWPERERAWIAHYRAVGASLLNATSGGQGAPGQRRTPEQRAAAAVVAAAGWSEARKAAQSAKAKAWAAVYWTEETRAERRGCPVSPEAKAKIAATLRARAAAPEVAAVLAAQSARGVAAAAEYWTPERRQANGEKSRSHWTPERKAAASKRAREQMLAAWTPERRAQQAERMRARRKRDAETLSLFAGAAP